MPVYEYRCDACRRKTSVLVRSVAHPPGVTCAHCGGASVQRVISSFAYHRGMGQVWENSGEPSLAGNSDDYYKDPRNIGRWTEQRLEQLGVEMPSEARQMIDAAREGEMPAPLNDL